MVEDPDLQGKLSQAIDGKGAFRRFKDVLMAYALERERWFAFRSEHCASPSCSPAQRPRAQPGGPSRLGSRGPRPPRGPGHTYLRRPRRPHLLPGRRARPRRGLRPRRPRQSRRPHVGPPAPAREAGHLPIPGPPRRGKSVETLRKNLREIADALGPRDLDTLTAFAEFLKARRAARSFSHHLHDAQDSTDPASQAEEQEALPPRTAANEPRRTPPDPSARFSRRPHPPAPLSPARPVASSRQAAEDAVPERGGSRECLSPPLPLCPGLPWQDPHREEQAGAGRGGAGGVRSARKLRPRARGGRCLADAVRAFWK